MRHRGCLHGALAQAFRLEGTPNVKPPDQNHMCSHKWRVMYGLNTVYLTLSQYRMYQGKRMPYLFGQRLRLRTLLVWWLLRRHR